MSKQEEIKQALAAAKHPTELYMVWDQRDGLMCIAEYDKAAQEYEEQLEAAKCFVSSYGSEENERVVFARIEKQAYVTIYETSDHSDLMAAWDEYERENTENAELDRLRKELEEARKGYINRELLMDYLKGLYMNKRQDYYKARNMHVSHDAEIQMRLLSEIQTQIQEKPHFDVEKYKRSVGQEGEGNQE